jgi:glycerol uptake facilitator-like aquaporin
MKNFFRELCSEFIGSMILVSAAVSSNILFISVYESGSAVSSIAGAITAAFTLCVLIYVFRPISGAHFNPLVTVVMVLERKVPPIKLLTYLPTQVAGGITGAVLAHAMFYDEIGGLIFVSGNVRADYKYIGEIVGTFILILVVLLLCQAGSDKVPAIIGLLVGGQAMATSSNMFANPQITIARMFTSSAAGIRPVDALGFVAMQFIGMSLAYFVYKLIFCKGRQEGSSE